jgi:hypothetical protein
MDKYLIGFFIGHALPNYKKVIIKCLIDQDDILDLNRNEIINFNNATFHSHSIFKILNIQDKKGNNYLNAVNIYNNDDIIFTLNNSITSKISIKFNINKAILDYYSKDKIKKIQKFDYNGQLILDGLYIDGIFNGLKIENDIHYKYKDGILI